MMYPPGVQHLLTSLCLVALGMITMVSSQANRIKMDGVTTRTLYSQQNRVVEVYTANLTETVSRANKAWAVQFYSSQCGACQRFQPTYVALAKDIKGWDKMVTLAALACSHPDNVAACRTHNIAVYPTIKYFPPNSAEDFRGLVYDCAENVSSLRMCLIDFLEGTVYKPLWWPRLDPFKTLDDVQDYIQEKEFEDKAVAIVMEEISSVGQSQNYIGREVILDLIDYPDVLVVRMLKDRAQNYGVDTYPSLYRFNSDRSITKMADEGGRKEFVNSIRMNILQIAPTTEEERENVLMPTYGEPIFPDGVHMQDLESGLYYSLFLEVSVKQQIEGAALAALQNYISTLVELLPVEEHVRLWLGNVRAWLLQKDSVSGEEWENTLSAVQTEHAYIPERVIWVGCLGTEPNYRGYPCSMWTTFHTLMTAAYNHTLRGGEGYDGAQLLVTIREFMRHFFGCGECTQNFLAETEDIETQVSSAKESMIWLWRKHNRVNQRLHDDPTEDPRHLKMQFPIYEKCPDCHAERPSSMFARTSWLEHEITQYLLVYYGQNNIIHDSAPFEFKAGRDYYKPISSSPALLSSLYLIFVSLLAVLV